MCGRSLTSPKDELSKIFKFIGIHVLDSDLEAAVSCVSSRSIGKGRKALGETKVAELEALVGTTINRLGYK